MKFQILNSIWSNNNKGNSHEFDQLVNNTKYSHPWCVTTVQYRLSARMLRNIYRFGLISWNSAIVAYNTLSADRNHHVIDKSTHLEVNIIPTFGLNKIIILLVVVNVERIQIVRYVMTDMVDIRQTFTSQRKIISERKRN